MSDFQREERFIVVKRKHLTPEKEVGLRRFLRHQSVEPIECVVVESDWPEYETVWQMIEARCTGKPMTDLTELKVLLAKATPGEWALGSEDDLFVVVKEGGLILADADPVGMLTPSEAVENAALIVALRNAAPSLIAEVEGLRAEVAKYREALEMIAAGDVPLSVWADVAVRYEKFARAALEGKGG